MAYTLVPTELIVDGAITSAKLDTNIAISGTLGVTGEVTLATHLIMGDNDKIKIGTGGDLEIYHDGSNSYISNSTGNIYLGDTNGAVHIQAKLNEESIICAADGAVTLYHDNSPKLATSSAGVTVTGTLAATLSTAAQPNITSVGTLTGLNVAGTPTFDGLTVDGTGDFNIGTENVGIDITSTDAGAYIGLNDNNATGFYLGTNAGIFYLLDTGNSPKLKIASNGDISFYEDTGTTAKFFWDASAESLGIGINNPTGGKLHVVGNVFAEGGSFYVGANGVVASDSTSRDLNFAIGNTTPKMTLDTAGRLLVNLTSNDNGAFIQTKDAGSGCYGWTEGTSAVDARIFANTSQGAVIATQSAHPLALQTSGQERMRVLSDGKVSVGGQSSNHLLNVTSATTPALEFTRGSGNATIGIDNGNSIAVGGTAGDLVLRASGTTGVTKITDSGGNITMTLTEANKVGIGISSPSSTLTVSGTIESLKDDTYGSNEGGQLMLRAPSASTTTAKRYSLDTFNVSGNSTFRLISEDDSNGANGVVRMALDTKGTFFFTNNLSSYGHNTYAHAAVFSRNSTPAGTVVIEDSDVSSGIGNTVLRCFLRDQDPATTAIFIDFADGGGRVGSVSHNDDGGGVSYNTTSDYRLKENVNYDWDALSLVNQLKPAKFNFLRNPAKTVQGFLAHEVSDIVPSSVRGNKDHIESIGTVTDSDGNVVHEGVYEHFCKTDEGQTWTRTGEEPIYQQLDYSRIVPLLTKAIQEQQTIIDDLKSRIETLEG